jgi:hypothetical protein
MVGEFLFLKRPTSIGLLGDPYVLKNKFNELLTKSLLFLSVDLSSFLNKSNQTLFHYSGYFLSKNSLLSG